MGQHPVSDPPTLCYETGMKTARHILPRLALVLAAALALPACSAASLAALTAGKPTAKVAAAPAIAPVPADRPAADAMVAEAGMAPFEPFAYAEPTGNTSSVDRLIAKYAAHYNVPETLVRRVVKRESGFNPAARNGPYYGLMQIRHDTARSMGYSGSASGLLDAETNLKYAVKYLAGAYIVGGRNEDQAMRYYSRGYYYAAKRQGLLEETGLR